jgi:type IV pilus assembly protein PilE
MRMMARRGFTLVELMVALALATLLVASAWPSYRAQLLRAARTDAVEALMRLQLAQEKLRAATGLYGGRAGALGGERSRQGLYAIDVRRTGAESYVASASALGGQADDRECAVITLEVDQGTSRHGPSPRCWNR